MWLKCGSATFAAIVFLLSGVEAAHASGIGDVVDDVSAVTESALPEPEDATLGDVVEEATAAVDDLTGTLVDEAVVDPEGVVGSTVEQATGTVAGAAGRSWSLRPCRSMHGTRWTS